MADLTHFDESGASRMVDVGGKLKPADLRVQKVGLRCSPIHCV